MRTKKHLISKVEESTTYDTLIDEVDEVETYQMGFQPPKPNTNTSPTPLR